MRLLWTLAKIVIALVIAVPLSILVLATALGILGTLLGVAVLALKVGVIALIGWGVFRVIGHLLGGPSKSQPAMASKPLAPPDRYYEAAMRELDRELGDARL